MIRLVVSLALLTVGSPLWAWNNFGHLSVAAVAYHNMLPTARKHAIELLRLNPDYPQWVANVPAAQRGEIAFMQAACWPDFIKHAAGYINDGERPTDPNASANVGYTDKLMHKYWHYVDLPFSPDHTPLLPTPVPNAETVIAEFRNTLASPTSSQALKSYDLVWLEHLVGDVHQPLHATSRFTRTQPNGDQGGNLVALCAEPCKDELHAFWDDALGTGSAIAAMNIARTLPRVSSRLAKIADESAWVKESLAIAEQSVYSSPIGVGAGPFTLKASYKNRAHKIAAQRVKLAGLRLANLLNAALQ